MVVVRFSTNGPHYTVCHPALAVLGSDDGGLFDAEGRDLREAISWGNANESCTLSLSYFVEIVIRA